MKAPLAQIWIRTELRAVAGSARVACVENVLSTSMVKRRRGDGEFAWSMALSDASAAEVLDDRVAELEFEDGTIEEWRITKRPRSVGPDGRIYRVVCQPILLDLGAASAIVSFDSLGIPTFAGRRTKISATDLIDLVIIPALIADGLTHFVRGTVDPTGLRDYEWTDIRPLGLAHMIEERTGGELQLEPDGATKFLINIRSQIGSDVPLADVRQAKNIRSLAIDSDSTERMSHCTGIGALDPAGRAAVIGGAVWEISARNLTTDRLTLVDPEGPSSIGEDDQYNGLYLYRASVGGTDPILDTIGSDVQVADASIYTVGDLVEIRQTAGTPPLADDAQRLTTLRKPSVTVFRVGTEKRPDLSGERNLLPNGSMLDFPGGVDALPRGVLSLSSRVVPRDLQSTDPADATLGGSALSLRYRFRIWIGAPINAGQPVIPLIEPPANLRVGMTLTVTSSAGTETKTVLSFTNASITMTTNFALTHPIGGGSGGFSIYEPGALDQLELIPGLVGWRQTVRALWPAVRAPVGGGSLFHALARITLRAAHPKSVVQLTAQTATRIAIASTTLTEQAVVLAVPIEAEPGETITLRLDHYIDVTYLTGNPFGPGPSTPQNEPYMYARFVSPAIPGDDVIPSTNRCIVDGIALTQTDYEPSKLPHYSSANALHHAVQQRLEAGSLAAVSLVCELIDLTALDRVAYPDDELLLGATVRVNHADLEAVNLLARIEEMRWNNLTVPTDPQLVLGTRRTPISEFIVDQLGGRSFAS